MKKALSGWLDSEANKTLFKKYYKKPIHKRNLDSPDRYKELLKCLAAWRIYDELGFKDGQRWTRGNRRRQIGHGKLFFKEKLKKIPSGQRYRQPLFKERRQWQAAIKKAESFLATEIELAARGMT